MDFEDFEGYTEGTQPNPLGNWTQSSSDTDDWFVYSGDGESGGTGPTTNYDGYYAMVETSVGACTSPDSAVLYRSPEIDFDSYDYVNISFARHMYGSTMGTLSIKQNSTGEWVTEWSESGDQGDEWVVENVSITGRSGTGNIAIWMDCGDSYTSDAAVDSVNITAGTIETEAFSFVSGLGWQVNVTVPTGLSGYQDLFLNATYGGVTRNETESNAINYVVSPTGTLNVTLISPTGSSNSQPQNQTFIARFNVTCEGTSEATCGSVSGRIRYNESSSSPDSYITGGNTYDVPFYTIENNIQNCGSLDEGDNPCQLSWTVNATGEVDTSYLIDAIFNSSISSSEDSENFEVLLIASSLSLTLSNDFFNIYFGPNLVPGSVGVPAENNSESAYNLTCYNSGYPCNVSIRGNQNLSSGLNSIGIDNIRWNKINDNSTGNPLSFDYSVINESLQDGIDQTLYFWLNLPNNVYAGTYKTNFTIYAETV